MEHYELHTKYNIDQAMKENYNRNSEVKFKMEGMISSPYQS